MRAYSPTSVPAVAVSAAIACVGFPLAPAGLLKAAHAQVDDTLLRYAGRPISRVTVQARDANNPSGGLPLAPAREQLAFNHIRTRPGTPFDPDTTVQDQRTLARLSGFGRIQSFVALLEDQSVAVRFVVENQAVIADVQTVGNRLFTDEKLAETTSPLIGSAIEPFNISSAAAQIEQMYRSKGYYLAKVTPNQEELAETGVLLFHVREGGLLKVSSIRFQSAEGELSFPYDALYDKIRTREIGLLEYGRLDQSVVDADTAALTRFYRDNGYLDVDVSRHVGFSPSGKEAQVTFIIREGTPYHLRSVKVYYPELARTFKTREEAQAVASGDPLLETLTLGPESFAVYAIGTYSAEQVIGLMDVKPGDRYNESQVERGLAKVRDALGLMGHVAVRVDRDELRGAAPHVDLLIEVTEGARARTGEVVPAGNTTTRHNVVRRLVPDVRSDRPLNLPAINEARLKLARSPYFSESSITVQPEDPNFPGYRDVLIEVKERSTATFEVGGLVGSDAGVSARLAYTQRNFDLANRPTSWADFLHGNGFRGGGQTLALELLPGTEVQTYSLSLTEPALMDSDYSLGGSVFFRNRVFRQYDEQRYGASMNLGRTFGSRWNASVSLRAESVDPRDIDVDAPVDYFDVQGAHGLTSVALRLNRTTVDDPFFPTKGNRIEFSAEQFGVLGGDFTFSRFAAGYSVYLPLYEDYFGRSTVLNVSTRLNYIPQTTDEVPFFERIYYGGSNFRAFSFRAISPLGVRNDTGTIGDDPVGGTWGFFLGAEVRQPVYQDIVSVVGFVDSGTVTNDPGFENYRVAVGLGLRFKFDALSPVPLAFDFGIPVMSEDGDRRRLLTFSIDFPFQ